MSIFLRTLCTLAVGAVITIFLVRAIAADHELRHLSANPHYAATPSSQLLLPNSLISLNADNTTTFPARPAAFGPYLPDRGLSAVLWIGSGFGEDGIEPQGELGCNDLPGWEGRRGADGTPIPPADPGLDDGTDDYLEDLATRPGGRPADHIGKRVAAVRGTIGTTLLQRTTPAAAESTTESANPSTLHSDIQSLQEGAEIAGTIVLLRRGGCGFLTKVLWAQRRGAVGVIIGDDRPGGPLVQMYANGDTSGVKIQSVFTTYTTAQVLAALAAAPPSLARRHATAAADQGQGHALRVTITPARGALSLLDTMLLVIASPMLAVIVVTTLLVIVRTHIRQRAWRAPKEVVDQLPVHVYMPPGTSSDRMYIPVGSEVASPVSSPPRTPSPPTFEPSFGPSLTTPLLMPRPRSRTTTGVPADERRIMMPVPRPPPSRYVQSECVVCLEEYLAGDRVMRLPCGHEFHVACIVPWLTIRRRTCPICKGDVVRATSGDAA